MKTVEIDIVLDTSREQYDFTMADPYGVIAKLVETFGLTGKQGRFEFKGVVHMPSKRKTSRQLGYWRGEVLPKIAHGLRDAGYTNTDEDKAETTLLTLFCSEEMLGKDGEIMRIPTRMSKVDGDELTQLIEYAIEFGRDTLGVTIEKPLQYYERKLQSGDLTQKQRARYQQLKIEQDGKNNS